MLQHPGTAELVVEIAVSSAALDREKAALYAEAGVPEYWIILASERRVEVYRQPENGSYRGCSVVEGDAQLQALSLPELSIPLADLFG
jgi:Uma2 family endonuclease